MVQRTTFQDRFPVIIDGGMSQFGCAGHAGRADLRSKQPKKTARIRGGFKFREETPKWAQKSGGRTSRPHNHEIKVHRTKDEVIFVHCSTDAHA
jgi:hypothetical protein